MNQTMGRIRRILIWLNIIVAVFAVIYVGGGYISKTDYNKNMQLGLQYEQTKAYGDAYRQFKRLIGMYPEDPRALLHYAKASYMCGRLDEMQEALIRLKKCRADNTTIDEYKQFEAVLMKEVVPSDELGSIITNLKKGTLASNVAALNDYLTQKPTDSLGFYILGNVYLEQEEYLKAIDAYGNVLRLKPDMIPALLNLSTAYRHIGYYSKAEYTASKAFEYSPGSSQAYIVMARVRLDMFDDVKAVDFAKKATELDPTNMNAKAILAAVTYYAGMQNDSLRLLSELKKNKYFDYQNLKDVIDGKLRLRR